MYIQRHIFICITYLGYFSLFNEKKKGKQTYRDLNLATIFLIYRTRT